MAVTIDLDFTAAQYVQFTLKYGCHGSVPTTVTRGNGILVQYSNNGGITWHLLKVLENLLLKIKLIFIQISFHLFLMFLILYRSSTFQLKLFLNII